MQLTALTGMPVRDLNGLKLGEVEELIVDVSEGAIESARLLLVTTSTGRGLRITVPWSQLRFADDGTRLELDIGLPTLIAVASRQADPQND